MSDNAGTAQGTSSPYKIIDHARERRKGITASSLKELTAIARNRFGLPQDEHLTIVLEQDGKDKSFTRKDNLNSQSDDRRVLTRI